VPKNRTHTPIMILSFAGFRAAEPHVVAFEDDRHAWKCACGEGATLRTITHGRVRYAAVGLNNARVAPPRGRSELIEVNAAGARPRRAGYRVCIRRTFGSDIEFDAEEMGMNALP